jgi:hypothetical protein
MVTKEELRKQFCNIKGWSFMQFDDGVEAQEYALFLEGKIEELSKLHQPTVIGSYSEKDMDNAYDKGFKDTILKYRTDL